MMYFSLWIGIVLIVLGVVFFLAGTAGLLRFPDAYTRLHALTKADNLGLGLVVAGLALHAEAWVDILRLLLIWLLVIISSATAAHIMAKTGLRGGLEPWKAP